MVTAAVDGTFKLDRIYFYQFSLFSQSSSFSWHRFVRVNVCVFVMLFKSKKISVHVLSYVQTFSRGDFLGQMYTF